MVFVSVFLENHLVDPQIGRPHGYESLHVIGDFSETLVLTLFKDHSGNYSSLRLPHQGYLHCGIFLNDLKDLFAAIYVLLQNGGVGIILDFIRLAFESVQDLYAAILSLHTNVLKSKYSDHFQLPLKR